MSLETALNPGDDTTGSVRLPLVWREALLRLGLVWMAIAVATWRDWWAMFDQWWNISTYNHILFVPLIVGWLVYIRRKELLSIDPHGWWPGSVLLAGALFVWLLGSIAGVNSASQLGAVVAIILAVPAMLGPRIALACAFPLGYLLFLVPFGDELVPALQMLTAAMVIWLTEASGVPAVVDGVFINTPAGLFEVAEACSGVKFLVAMVALGVLVSYACFTRWRMRALFMAIAIILPIMANGVRAWGTIYIAQSQGIAFAEGFDHIFYGWVFFAVIVFLLLAAFWRRFDREPDDLGIDFPVLLGKERLFRRVKPVAAPGVHVAVTLAALLCFAGWQMGASAAEADLPQTIELPQVAGWQQVDYAPAEAWQPRLGGADHTLLGRYRDAAGHEIDVVVALYAAQSDGREAGASGEGALVPDTPWRWLGPWDTDAAGSGEALLAHGRIKRFAVTSYRSGALLTGSTARLKLHSMADRLLIARRPTMTLILSVETPDAETAQETIARFDASIADRGEWMDRIAGLR